jgi:hypothetical protein
MWEINGWHELWGGHFIDRQEWTMSTEESKRFCEWLPEDSCLEVFDTWSAFERMSLLGATPAENFSNELKIRWSSWEECNVDQRSGKRRADLRKHIERFDKCIKTFVSDETSGLEVDRLIHWSKGAVDDEADWLYGSKPILRGTKRLIEEASRNKSLMAIKLYDANVFAGGALLFVVDSYAYLHMAHSDKDMYPWLGKRLYVDIISTCIKEKISVISGGWGLSGLKKSFGFEQVKCWRLGKEC